MGIDQFNDRQHKTEDKLHGGVMEALCVVPTIGTYSSLVILLRIFATTPVTTATGKRSSRTLKFIKNYLRSTTTGSRLNKLTHLFINSDIKLDYNKGIGWSGGAHTRRLKFIQTAECKTRTRH
jgi:hypothetical protein